MTAVRALPCGQGQVHWEKRRGPREAARAYCMKDDTRDGPAPFEIGQWDPAAQGNRTDLVECAAAIMDGVPMRQIARDWPGQYIRYYRGMQKLSDFEKPEPHPEGVDVRLLFGPPGVGKTKSVHAIEEAEKLWVAPVNESFKWFDNYANHEAVLFDEFDGAASKVPLATVLQVLDRYVVQVSIKGGFTWFNPKRIYICTNYHPKQWYDWATREQSYGALKRRFSTVEFWPAGATELSEDEPTIISKSSPSWDDFWANYL